MSNIKIKESNLVTQYLTLYLTDNQEGLLPTEKMVEILSIDVEKILVIPETPKEVMGVFNWRQQIIWLIDLPSLLWLTPLSVQKKAILNVVVVKHKDQNLGLAFTENGKIINGKPENPNILLIDTEALFNSLEK